MVRYQTVRLGWAGLFLMCAACGTAASVTAAGDLSLNPTSPTGAFRLALTPLFDGITAVNGLYSLARPESLQNSIFNSTTACAERVTRPPSIDGNTPPDGAYAVSWLYTQCFTPSGTQVVSGSRALVVSVSNVNDKAINANWSIERQTYSENAPIPNATVSVGNENIIVTAAVAGVSAQYDISANGNIAFTGASASLPTGTFALDSNVTDTLGAAPYPAKRVLDGTVRVALPKLGQVLQGTMTALEYDPFVCLWPLGGTLDVTVTLSGGGTTHGQYQFGGTCGTVTWLGQGDGHPTVL